MPKLKIALRFIFPVIGLVSWGLFAGAFTGNIDAQFVLAFHLLSFFT